jgi:exosortase/archaeosortase family protein
MTGHRLRILGTLVLTFATVWVGFYLLLDTWRGWEAAVVTGTLQALGVAGVRGGYGNLVLVVPPQGRAFIASISPSCSSLGAVLAFGAIALFMVGGSVVRRLGAFMAASVLVVVCNLVRIGLSIWVGVVTDTRGLVVFHDWVGTTFGVVYVLVGFMVFLFVLLPSNRQLAKGLERAR